METGKQLTIDRVYFFNAYLAKDSRDSVEDLEGRGRCWRRNVGGATERRGAFVDRKRERFA